MPPATSEPTLGKTVDRVPPRRELSNDEHRAGTWTASAPSPTIISDRANREVSARGWHRDHGLAGGSVTNTGPGGPLMTVMYESPRLNRIGSLHSLTLTHQEGSNADVGSSQAAHANPNCGTG
jgi:hypothetical protein